MYHQISQEQINNSYFINNSNVIKICVIDHAEIIEQKDQYLELCKKLHENRCIFIFVAKKDVPSIAYWEEIVKKASCESEDDSYLGILRSEENYHIVKPYSIVQCKEIFLEAILQEKVKVKVLSMAETLGEELRRPYYFDFLIKEINNYKDYTQIPEKLDDSNLMLKIFHNALEGIIAHLKGYVTLKEYLDGYYDSTFVKNYSYGEHSRIPFDNYAWAYGIMHCIGKSNYADTIAMQFNYLNSVYDLDFKSQLEEINERIVQLFYSEKRDTINKYFLLEKYFLHIIDYSLEGSRICSIVLNKCLKKINKETCNTIFKRLCEKYNKTIDCKEEIYVHNMLGMQIGTLLPNMECHNIAEGLKYIFDYVCDDYVLPKCNENGIAVIPVTNFEYEKFVKDNGYNLFYTLESQKPLNEIATDYYKEIFDFIIGALNGSNRKDSNCLARILKGYGWDHYKQIAYLLSKKGDINNKAIYDFIGKNYPNRLLYPAKWKNGKNEDVRNPFCNPLQPVVCVNIYEARAYANWLSSKTGKKVRLLNYDPDYLSVIGKDEASEAGTLRQMFLAHINRKREYINSSENSTAFYCRNDIKIKEPSVVAMPNSKFLGLYDFVGNIFETQDTPFMYNYAKNIEEIRQGLKKVKEVYIDYNCPGGGLQRTAANWPPEYMGQVPAFLRNQDIGFRIVIDGKDIGTQKHKNRHIEHIHYSESFIESFTCTMEESASILSNIHLKYADTNEDIKHEFIRSAVFCNKEKSSVLYIKRDTNISVSKEAILLVQKGEDIYAYHLIGITSVQNDEKKQNIHLKMVIRKPEVPIDLATRKKLQNSSFSEWIDIVELMNGNDTDIFKAYPVNILNGYFRIVRRNVRYAVFNGQEHKRSSKICNSYLICFNEDSQNWKTTYYEGFKEKLGANCFLPDWIDIVDFINNICVNVAANVLDIETVMAAISTIDTSDLHEQINNKILKK